MTPDNVRDLGSTLAGGGAGMGLLLTVKWELVPHGECVKIGVALVLIVLGYTAYRKTGQA
jgi:hypothetical protein